MRQKPTFCHKWLKALCLVLMMASAAPLRAAEEDGLPSAVLNAETTIPGAPTQTEIIPYPETDEQRRLLMAKLRGDFATRSPERGPVEITVIEAAPDADGTLSDPLEQQVAAFKSEFGTQAVVKPYIVTPEDRSEFGLDAVLDPDGSKAAAWHAKTNGYEPAPFEESAVSKTKTAPLARHSIWASIFRGTVNGTLSFLSVTLISGVDPMLVLPLGYFAGIWSSMHHYYGPKILEFIRPMRMGTKLAVLGGEIFVYMAAAATISYYTGNNPDFLTPAWLRDASLTFASAMGTETTWMAAFSNLEKARYETQMALRENGLESFVDGSTPEGTSKSLWQKAKRFFSSTGGQFLMLSFTTTPFQIAASAKATYTIGSIGLYVIAGAGTVAMVATMPQVRPYVAVGANAVSNAAKASARAVYAGGKAGAKAAYAGVKATAARAKSVVTYVRHTRTWHACTSVFRQMSTGEILF